MDKFRCYQKSNRWSVTTYGDHCQPKGRNNLHTKMDNWSMAENLKKKKEKCSLFSIVLFGSSFSFNSILSIFQIEEQNIFLK